MSVCCVRFSFNFDLFLSNLWTGFTNGDFMLHCIVFEFKGVFQSSQIAILYQVMNVLEQNAGNILVNISKSFKSSINSYDWAIIHQWHLQCSYVTQMWWCNNLNIQFELLCIGSVQLDLFIFPNDRWALSSVPVLFRFKNRKFVVKLWNGSLLNDSVILVSSQIQLTIPILLRSYDHDGQKNILWSIPFWINNPNDDHRYTRWLLLLFYSRIFNFI